MAGRGDSSQLNYGLVDAATTVGGSRLATACFDDSGVEYDRSVKRHVYVETTIVSYLGVVPAAM